METDKSTETLKLAKQLEKRIVHEGKWLRTCEVDYETETGSICKSWEMVERTRIPPTAICNAVDILPIVKYSNGKKQLLLIANYRPPTDRYSVELPSGLVEEGMDLIENAKRELKEETGYTVQKIFELDFCPVLCIDPWKSNETTKVFMAYIDGDDPSNQNPKQDLENEENIHPFLVDIDNQFVENLKKIVEENNYILPEAIYTLCLGVQLFGLAK